MNAFENKCYRKILNVHWSEHRTDQSIQQELKLKPEELLRFVKKQELKYFGHTSRHESLEKLFLEGRVEGCKKRGRPRRKWTDDVCERLGIGTVGGRSLSRLCWGCNVPSYIHAILTVILDLESELAKITVQTGFEYSIFV